MQAFYHWGNVAGRRCQSHRSIDAAQFVDTNNPGDFFRSFSLFSPPFNTHTLTMAAVLGNTFENKVRKVMAAGARTQNPGPGIAWA